MVSLRVFYCDVYRIYSPLKIIIPAAGEFPNYSWWLIFYLFFIIIIIIIILLL